MWQIILWGLSAILFFGFVILSIKKFGLLSCFSDYSSKWKEAYPAHNFNWWSFVTIISAALLIPVTLQLSEGSNFQFAGFLAPVALFLVGCTPDWKTDKGQNVFHQIGAYSAILFLIIYIVAVPKMLVLLIGCVVLCLMLSLAKEDTVYFWVEMAMYISMYLVLAGMLHIIRF